MNQNKPIVSYWKNSDPCKNLNLLKNKLTDINIIRTKNITREFSKFCLETKNLYLHIVINGMGGTIFEPNIPTVRTMFYELKYLIDNGFSQSQILVIVDPIIPNDNGLNALKLLLRLFTEFKPLRLRFIRFIVLQYSEKYSKDGKKEFLIGNENISKRSNIKYLMKYLIKSNSFWNNYQKLIKEYEPIISVDSNTESLIGVRELMPFGYNNSWFNTETKCYEKIITYKNGNKFKPLVNIISPNINGFIKRCSNKCLLCPWY